MNSATPALLAFLLVCSLPAMSVVAAGPTGGEVDDATREPALQKVPHQEGDLFHADGTTNRLRLTGEVNSEHAEYKHDLGTALAISDDRLRVDHDQYVFLDSEFDDATTDSERSELAETAYGNIKERIEAIETRERQAVRAHANGDLSDIELLRVLIRNYEEARVLHESLTELDDRTDDIRSYSLPEEQLRADRTLLDFHQTPVRSSLRGASETPREVLIETSQDGYSLAMLSDETYVVETTRFDNRNTDGPDQFENYEEAIDRTSELYPWAGIPQHFQDNSYENLYWMDIIHEQGSLEVYLDTGTGEVHREVQELSTQALPQQEPKIWSNDGLELSLNETPTNGPAKVKVTDPVTGEPEVATITVDGVEIGETNADGTLWFLPPQTEYELGAETETESISATVSS